ncbi:FKBP-type peptidyl-prolyl cis-trans isomerase [Thermoflavifilum aggregans]|uniref:Peptidyl-prolyl cis-trans isomerase n=1 Tax=Thermoflavifilum aggregans TaxID=454188 RepID=A0A2M9CUN0_9BACT|nr:FKBP-type peptidyl-prolyl cis-trans isomerase [Thermoflavifilum aggregans]PJJ75518.1 FKBP-type peptidyl-prolyl cis-trans isomerase [Thermoflavifilum aggregans]
MLNNKMHKFTHLPLLQSMRIGIVCMVLGTGLAACQSAGYQKTPGGISYKIIEKHNGPKPQVGDYLKLQITTSVGDTVLMDTHKMGGPTRVQLQKPQGRFDIMEALALLSPGDSAIFLIPADSVIPDISRFPYIKKGDNLKIAVKLLAVQNFQQMQEDLQKEHAAQLEKDEKIIEDYLNKNHLTASKTPGGVYIVVHQEGMGPVPQAGDQVQINYTGRSLDGKPFDSNVDTSFQIVHHPLEPFIFTIGQGQVLKGMDEAIMQMKEGTKATIYIPSGLGYGPAGQPPVIEPNEILAFDIDLLKVKPASKAK